MKTKSSAPLAMLLLGLLLSVVTLPAQSTNESGRRTIPSAEKLARQGQVATPAEAKPLIEQYYAEQEQLFQERRAAILAAQGKTPDEALKIMAQVVADQRERRVKQRQLEARISAMLKHDREEKGAKKEKAPGR